MGCDRGCRRLRDVRCHHVDRRLLLARDAQATPCGSLHIGIGLALPLRAIQPLSYHFAHGNVVHWADRRALRHLCHHSVVQWLCHAVVEVDTALRRGKGCLEPVDLRLAHLFAPLQEVPRDAFRARRRGQRAIPMVVALRELICQFLVEVEILARVLNIALLHGKDTPKLVEELVALALVTQLVEQPDHRETVVGTMERYVVELVHKVGLHRKGLPINGILGGGVPVYLVEVELVASDHGVALACSTEVVHDIAPIYDVVVRLGLKQLETVPSVLHV
mmetsp:Transcript_88765/g.224255  ORF Transcript_88765/g.224255 Transcript_88765/m.224255 type:complete len:277 (+) Transcript_88765:596-1426(+)